MATREEIARWAVRKFGQSGLERMGPSLPELEALYAYDKAHPGLSAGDLQARVKGARDRGTAGTSGSTAGGGLDPNVSAFQHPQGTDPATLEEAARVARTDPKTAPARKKAATAKAAEQAQNTAAFQTEAGGNPELAAALKGLPAQYVARDPKTGQVGLSSAGWDWASNNPKDPRVVAFVQAQNGGTASGEDSAILSDTLNPKAKIYLDAPVSRDDQIIAADGNPAAGYARSTDRGGGLLERDSGAVLTGLYKMDPDTIKALKKKLWDGHFYASGTDAGIVDTAKVDNATLAAYRAVIVQAGRYHEAGQTFTLDDVIAQGNPDPASGATGAAVERYTITNPVDLKTALLGASQERLGRDLSDDEINTFTKLYQGMEAQASQRYAAAGRNNQAFGGVKPPEVGSAAGNYIDDKFKAQEQAYGAVQRQFEFYDLLGGNL